MTIINTFTMTIPKLSASLSSLDSLYVFHTGRRTESVLSLEQQFKKWRWFSLDQ